MNKRIVLLIAEAMPIGLTPLQIRQKIPELTPQNLNMHLKILLRKGIIKKHKESSLTYYIITPPVEINRLVVEDKYFSGQSAKPAERAGDLPQSEFQPSSPAPADANPLNASSASQPEPPEPSLQARAHKFGIAYPLKDPLDPATPIQLLQLAGIPVSQLKLNNNQQAYFAIGSITARLTNSALLLYASDIYTDNRTPSIEAEAKIKAEFDAIALKLEQKLQRIASFKLRRIDKDTLESHITTQHWAEEHHPLAEAGEENHMILARSPIDGNVRLDTDKSKGFRELETKHAKSADLDKDTLDEQFNGILDHKISLLDIPRLNAIADFHSQAIADQDKAILQIDRVVGDLSQRMLTYATNIEAHANAIKDLSIVAAKLNATLDQLAAVRQQQEHKQGLWGRLKNMLKKR
ncbi:MAG: helix-turn-helix domain-containing protein [Candidatus Micrarchaeaceae archaeon]